MFVTRFALPIWLARHMVLSACLILAFAVALAPAARAGAADDLAALLEMHDQNERRLYPSTGVQRGDDRYLGSYEEDLTSVHVAERQRVNTSELELLARIDPAALSEEDRLSYDILQWKLDDKKRALAPAVVRLSQLLPLNQFSGAHIAFAREMQWRSDFPFNVAGDYRKTIERMRGFSRWIDQAILNMREGARAGVVLPKIVVERMLPEVESLADNDMRRSVFAGPVRNMSAYVTEPERSQVASEFYATAGATVVPTYRRLAAFLRNDYLPLARDSVGLSAIPDGKEFYLYLVRSQTSEDLTPDAIHALGLAELARIETEMEEVKTGLGFTGDLKAFHASLRANPRFRFADQAALVAAFERANAQVMAHVGTLFGTLPKARLEFRVIENYSAPSKAAAEYSAPSADGRRPGIVYINGYDLASRASYTVAGLALHEGVPGHHLQLSLAVENTAIPAFRRYGTEAAFVEGWGLYAESLGAEMGMFADPYEKFGELSFDAWRACRLVVDTGIHWLGWSRERALEFLLAHTALSETDAAAEVERYIALPGQALAYKIGQRKFLELRERAQTELGATFDIRRFHDAVLSDGAMPLPILDAKINRWIAAEKARH